MPFSRSRIPSKTLYHYIQPSCLLRPLMTMTVSQTPLFMMTLTVWGQSGVLYNVSRLEFEVSFVWVVLWGFGKKTTEGKCHSLSIIWRVRAMNLAFITVTVHLSCRRPGAQVSLVWCYFPALYTVPWEQVVEHSAHFRGEWFCSTSLRRGNIYINNLEFFCKEDFFSLSFI